MIAATLGISHRTVQFHTDNLYWKLSVSGLNARDRAVKRARELSLID
jgi:ATP/maltotriose-dependent transcriptional regulator MalT